ncbi:MAG: hypothetical protein K1Y36_16215 [Blastocatellia bacterium]|nr:hypothetical protein [Blastocatellia bacterium]
MKRLAQVMDVILERYDAEACNMVEEHTVTDMVARNGVSVMTRHPVPVGELLLFKMADNSFESSAVVRSARYSDDMIQRLTLEFVGEHWQQKWIYADSDSVAPLFEEFYEAVEGTALLLKILLDEREQETVPDQVFLSELQESLDQLRNLTFLIRNA